SARSSTRPPRVDGRPAGTRSVLGVQRTLEPQLEERVVAREGTRGSVGLVDHLPDSAVVDAPCTSGHGELVVDLWVGKGVQSVAAVAQEVVDLRRLVSDEHVEATVRDDRTDRMDARTAVLPDRRQIAEPDAELVDEGPPGLRHLRLLGC